MSQQELASWERLGEGGFSSVYKAKLKGNDVAVKVLKNLKETKPLLTEGNLLRFVSLLSTPTTLPARGGRGGLPYESDGDARRLA